jgi:hypothetical protein
MRQHAKSFASAGIGLVAFALSFLGVPQWAAWLLVGVGGCLILAACLFWIADRNPFDASPGTVPPDWDATVSIGPGLESILFEIHSRIGAQLVNGSKCEVRGPQHGPRESSTSRGSGLVDRIGFRYPDQFPDADQRGFIGSWDVRWLMIAGDGEWTPFLEDTLAVTPEALAAEQRRLQLPAAERLLKGLYEFRRRIRSRGPERSYQIRDEYAEWLPNATEELQRAAPDLIPEWNAYPVDPAESASREIDGALLRAIDHQAELLEKLRERARS